MSKNADNEGDVNEKKVRKPVALGEGVGGSGQGGSRSVLGERLKNLGRRAMPGSSVAMCYAGPLQRERTETCAYLCPHCKASTLYSEARDEEIFSYLKDAGRAYADSWMRLNRAGAAWRMRFAFDESALCNACRPPGEAAEVHLVVTYTDCPDQAPVRTSFTILFSQTGSRLFGSLLAFLGDEEAGDMSELNYKNTLRHIRRILGL